MQAHSRGLGFLISKKLSHRVSTIEVINKDANILWIQLIATNQTYYLAVVYIPHGEKQNAPTTIQNLALNCTELALTGIPLIMGDLNIRCDKTGDKAPNDSVNKANIKALNKFLKSANYSILLDSNMIQNDNHWTFRFPGGGQSIPDYILYPTSHMKNISNYKINWAINCGSYHAMQTFNLKINGLIKPNFWNTEPEPSLFSFNSPYGACQTCSGLGEVSEANIDKIIPNPKLSIKKGGFTPLGEFKGGWIYDKLENYLSQEGYSITTPLEEIPEEIMNVLLYGNDDLEITGKKESIRFEGIIPFISRHSEESTAGVQLITFQNFVLKLQCWLEKMILELQK
jgi:hypothetical protein